MFDNSCRGTFKMQKPIGYPNLPPPHKTRITLQFVLNNFEFFKYYAFEHNIRFYLDDCSAGKGHYYSFIVAGQETGYLDESHIRELWALGVRHKDYFAGCKLAEKYGLNFT